MELLTVRIAAETDISRIRQVTGTIAQTCGLENFAKTRAVTAVLEIARNALQYAGGGRAHYLLRSDPIGCLLVVRIVDQGEGLPDRTKLDTNRHPLNSAASSAQSSGLGLGLSGVKRLADKFDLQTTSEGTRVEMAFLLPSASIDRNDLAARIRKNIEGLSKTDPLAELSRQNRELAEAMAERELLIAEVHHRTGNNLALIVGFIQLSKRAATSDETRLAMTELEARVHSVANVHQELQRSSMADRVSLLPILDKVAKHATAAFSSDELDISIDVFGDAANVSGSAGVDLGLIVNELITNAYKHAFTGRSTGRISITFECEDYGNSEPKWVLLVKDDGVGLADDVKPEKSDSLGWKMIRALTSRLAATLSTGSHDGFFARIEFPSSFAKPME